tara:strand:- start:1207 stop:1806 length:600 start_codon:yes stop_codon:yes gene_type:complete
MSFWAENYGEVDSSGSPIATNPKRDFRFKIEFQNMSKLTSYGTNGLWYAKTSDKPSFSLGEATHAFLNHTFKFPGRVSWSDVTITMVDPGPGSGGKNSGLAIALAKMLKESGYIVPAGPKSDYQTISKSKAVSAIGVVRITQLSPDGTEIEAWVLHNAFLTDAKFGTLSYGSEELTEYSLTLKYDWADYEELPYQESSS